MFLCCQLLPSFLVIRRRHFWYSTAAVLLLAFISASGCEKSVPTETAPPGTPWLDPTSQIKSLKDGSYRVRGLAALNLGNMGAKASDAIPDLEKLSREDPNEKVRENARQAVEKIRAAANKPN